MIWYELEPVFFICASVGSALFTTLFIMSIIGFGDDHGELQHGDANASASDLAFKLFSLQSILALLMGFGFAGLACRIEWTPLVLLSDKPQ